MEQENYKLIEKRNALRELTDLITYNGFVFSDTIAEDFIASVFEKEDSELTEEDVSDAYYLFDQQAPEMFAFIYDEEADTLLMEAVNQYHSYELEHITEYLIQDITRITKTLEPTALQ